MHPSLARHAAFAATLSLGSLAAGVGAQEYPDEGYAPAEEQQPLPVRLWFDRGDEPVLERGERVRVYYRTEADAYVAIFNIDTNGTVRMVYPRSPEEQGRARAGRDYRLLFPRSPYWYVDDQPGLGYFFVVASPRPLDLSPFEYSYYDRGWDLSRVGRTVYSDPYVAMDDYVAALIPGWQYVAYGLGFATYHVGRERYDYPRFLCYDCHGFRSYASWNPYHYHCSNFRIVIYDDPWYYPSYRYSGTRVVYSGIPRVAIPRANLARADLPLANLPRFEFKERADGEAGPPLIATRATSGSRPGVATPPFRRSPAGAVPGDGEGDERSGRTARPRPSTADVVSRPGVPSSRPSATPGRSGTEGATTAAPRTGGSGEGSSPTMIRFPRRPRAGEASEPRFVPVVGPRSSPSERSRPVLERRPATPTRGSAGGEAGVRSRPSAAVRPPARSGSPGGSGTVRGGSGGGAGSARPSGGATLPTRPSAGGRALPTRPSAGGRALPTRPSAGGGALPRRPPARAVPSRGGATVPTRPSVRPRSGGGGSSTPSRVRSGGTPSRTAPPKVKPRGGGSSGGAASRVRPPRRPPTRPPPSGGGGGG